MLHAPVVQPAVPWLVLHTVPQMPQLVVLVFVLVSQPLVRLLSQLPQPALQVIPHVLAPQVAVPLVPLHARPHDPQFVGLVVTLVSQPSVKMPLQLAKPGLQVIPQVLALQVAVPLLPLHARPHDPQFVGLVVTLVSQPLEVTPSQFENPALHDWITQPPVAHPATAFARLHTMPQVPQFNAFVLVLISQPSTVSPLQFPYPALQLMLQTPVLQIAVPLALPHTVPQRLQLFGLDFRLISHPSAALPLQSPKPAVQAIEQALPLQLAVPLVLLHAAPHPPQLDTVLVVLTSQPSAVTLLQLAKPVVHPAMAQAPPAQAGVALVREQALLHAPQLPTLRLVLVSQPLPTLLSQLP